MQAFASATQQLGVAREKPSLMTRIREMVKELLEELFIYFLKFKAWLTPGTADDKVRTPHSLAIRIEKWPVRHKVEMACSTHVGFLNRHAPA